MKLETESKSIEEQLKYPKEQSVRRRGRLRSTKSYDLQKTLRSTRTYDPQTWLFGDTKPEVRVKRFEGHGTRRAFRPKVNGWTEGTKREVR